MRGTASVVGSGPNGLAAAVVLASAGLEVTVYEAADTAGGSLRSGSPLGPGTVTDLGAAVMPFGIASPLLSRLPLERHGLRWVHPELPLAHPLEGRPAAVLHRDLDTTADGLGRDARAWRAVHGPAVRQWEPLVEGVLGPLLTPPRAPLTMASFGARGVWPASLLARTAFREPAARALFAGSASHAVLPLSRPFTSAFGVLFGAAAAATGWPVVQGGSQRLADALVALLVERGGSVRTGARITDLSEVAADVVLLDLTPRQVLALAGDRLPARYAAALGRWRYGVAASKVDFLLDGPVPWSDPRVAGAGTVHVVGSLQELERAEAEVAAGRVSERPFVLLAQQSAADPTRAPHGRQVVWAYAHVPHGSDRPAAEAITAQVERFAPGFRDRVLAQVETRPSALQAWNPNLVGGDVGGGSLAGRQQLLRPVASTTPWATPLPGVFLCSSSTPPGGGVHGMPGYHAARTALTDLARRRRSAPFPDPLDSPFDTAPHTAGQEHAS